MGIFKLNSQFQVAGDQQQAIEKLVKKTNDIKTSYLIKHSDKSDKVKNHCE